MGKRVTLREHIEEFFCAAPLDACAIERDRIDLILRVRGAPEAPKRGRKPKPVDDSVAAKEGRVNA